MAENRQQISLGFTKDHVPAGTHVCLIFTDDDERKESLLKFMLSGLRNSERTASFSENINEEIVRDYLQENNISYDERKDSNAISLSGTGEIYFKDGKFDPDRMINTLTEFYKDAEQMGFSGSRVIGEMIPEVRDVPGGDRLMEYESKVTLLLRDYPVTSVCQYDARLFDGATIMDVMKVHPKMIVNGAIVENPFFIKPEEYLEGLANDGC